MFSHLVQCSYYEYKMLCACFRIAVAHRTWHSTGLCGDRICNNAVKNAVEWCSCVYLMASIESSTVSVSAYLCAFKFCLWHLEPLGQFHVTIFFAVHSFYHSLRKGRLKQTHAQNYNDQTDRTFGRNAHWHVLAFCGHITAFLLLHNSKRSIIICDAIVKFVVILIHQSPCNAGSMTPNGIYNYPTHTKC